jgi:S1-C subfamily serine protease
VENARAINVRLSGNETRPAEVVGLDDTTDLAVLKIPSGGLVAAEWGDSNALEVGAPVWAVGNPFGLDRSVSFGIVSAKNRRVISETNPYEDFLQTDAAVNPGNSGGPLVDAGGKIVGINTAIVGRGYQGVSFSIPSSIAKDVYERLRANGRVVRGYMGLRLMDLAPETAQTLGLKSTAGALVAQVESGTPAARAGLEVEDVIVKWDGEEVANSTELTMRVGKAAIGSRVTLTVIRDGAPREIELTIGERPPRLGR